MSKNDSRHHMKRSGSVLIYMSVIMVAITTVVVGTVQLNVVASQKAERRIEDAKAEATFDAQVAQVTELCRTNAITLPYTFTSTLNGRPLDCTVTDNDSVMSHSYKVTSTGSTTYNRQFTKVIGGRQAPHPFYYALYVYAHTNLAATGVITSGTGSVYASGNLTLGASSSIDGDACAWGTVTLGGATIDKNVCNSTDVPFTNLSATLLSNLKADATLLSSLPAVNGISFLSLLVNGHYALNYYNIATSFSGLLSGKGTAVFEKNVTITGNVSYLSGAARHIFIVNGDLTINPGVTRLDGFWYVRGTINATGTTTTLSNTRGSLVSGFGLTTTRPLNIVYDNGLWAVRPEAVKHCVPGFWPTAAADVMR